jgi:hypothetical protein
VLDYVQRVVYNHYKVTVRGSVPIRPLPGVQSSEASTLEFRIEGEIKGAMLHGRRTRKGLDDGPLTAWGPGAGLEHFADPLAGLDPIRSL